MNKNIRIVFMGTPDFAVHTLDTLVTNGFQVVGVITAPDRPAGRGQKLQQSAVKVYAESKGLKILQPERLKDPSFLEELHALQADLQIVVAFRMLPEVVWNMPPKGTFNLHASLLPQYRGAAPINWAIINGEKESGVTTFFIEKEIDTGNIIHQEKVAIAPNETAGELHDKLMTTGANLVLKTVNEIAEGTVKTTSQTTLIREISELKPAPKLFKEDGELSWDEPISNIYNKIRGLSPYPCAWTTIKKGEESLSLRIYDAKPLEDKKGELKFVSDNKTFLHIQTPNGSLNLLDIQLAGKKRMDIKAFLMGNNIDNYHI